MLVKSLQKKIFQYAILVSIYLVSVNTAVAQGTVINETLHSKSLEGSYEDDTFEIVPNK